MTHLLTFALALALGQQGPSAPASPVIYFSPDKHYVLRIDPDDAAHPGGFRYKLVQDGKAKWEKHLPYRLEQVTLNTRGQYVGYGLQSVKGSLGQLVIASGNPAGNVKVVETHPLQASQQVKGQVYPKIEGAFYSPDVDELVLRISNPDEKRKDEEWWTYAVGPGLNVTRLRPSVQMGKEAETYSDMVPLSAKPIPGTPLTLIAWHTVRKSVPGTMISIVDVARKPVWRLDLSGKDENPVLSIGDRRFTLRLPEKNERVQYGMAPGNMNWTVFELMHRPLQSSDHSNAQ